MSQPQKPYPGQIIELAKDSSAIQGYGFWRILAYCNAVLSIVLLLKHGMYVLGGFFTVVMVVH